MEELDAIHVDCVVTVSGEDENEPCCAVCLECDDNTILFCHGCNLAVHQLCYGILDASQAEWRCNICALKNAIGASDGATVSSTCVLCYEAGGALKPTTVPGQWVHIQCAAWIPEVSCLNMERMEPFDISRLDKKRFRLRCSLCSSRGACIQCCFGRCSNFVHARCALLKNSRYTNRTVKDEDGFALRQIFCTSHMDAVNIPLKPKTSKQKARQLLELAQLQLSITVTSQPANQSCSSHIVQEIRPSSGITATDITEEVKGAARDLSKLMAATDLESRPAATAGPSDDAEVDDAIRTSCILSDWPHQADGKDINLAHFWDVVSEYYSPCSTVELNIPDEDMREMNTNLSNSTTHELPPLGQRNTRRVSSRRRKEPDTDFDFDKLSNLTGEKLFAVAGHRGLPSAFDFNVRQEFQENSAACSSQLMGLRCVNNCDDMDKSSVCKLMSEKEFYTKSFITPPAVSKGVDNSLSIIFDSSNEATLYRYQCTFEVVCHDVDTTDNGWIRLELTEESMKDPVLVDSFLQDLVISPAASRTLVDHRDGSVSVFLKLVDTKVLSELDNGVVMSDRLIICKNEDDIICRMIRSDQHVLTQLEQALECKVKELTQMRKDELRACIASNTTEHETFLKWRKLEQRYAVQQHWKKVATCAFAGMKDQTAGFNHNEIESVPLSWTIKVTGRPLAADAVAEEEGFKEDAVCMVCFHGSSLEGNRILFCDGCNASLHQACYGIADIPDGDFFCSRCLAIKELAANPDIAFTAGQTLDVVKCCLCPLQHGGLKPTTDGRWVHMCCALWSTMNAENNTGAVLPNIWAMSPVEVSAVPTPCDLFVPPPLTSNCYSAAVRKFSYNVSEGMEIPDSKMARDIDICRCCGYGGGHLVKYVPHCTNRDASTLINTSVVGDRNADMIHPLCGWFEGYSIKTVISDPSFEGNDRKGCYPSCLLFQFCCPCVENDYVGESEDESTRDPTQACRKRQEVQRTIRLKYRLNEEQLMEIPGQSKKKKRKEKGHRRSSVGAYEPYVVPELTPDVYANVNICGVCMSPLERIAHIEKARDLILQNTDATMAPEDAAVRLADVDNAMPVDTSSVTSTTTIVNTAQIPSHFSCIGCGVSVHTDCHELLGDRLPSTYSMGWKCNACSACDADPEVSPACVLCPRRGGLMKPTKDGYWAHPFCARYTSSVAAGFSADGLIELQPNPVRESRRPKCLYCSRNYGTVVKCSHLGCNTCFHAMCGERSGQVYIYARQGTSSIYCCEHIPDGVHRIAVTRETTRPSLNDSAALTEVSYMWLDVCEIQKLKNSADTALSIMERIYRREKIKKLIDEKDVEVFIERYSLLLNRITSKQKPPAVKCSTNRALMKFDEDGNPLLDSVPSAGRKKKDKKITKSTDKGDGEGNSPVKRKRVSEGHTGYKAKKEKKEKEVIYTDVLDKEGLPTLVSSTWLKSSGDAVKLPKYICTSFSGQRFDKFGVSPLPLDDSDTSKYVSVVAVKKSIPSWIEYKKLSMKAIQQTAYWSRASVGMFRGKNDCENFDMSLGKELSKMLKTKNL